MAETFWIGVTVPLRLRDVQAEPVVAHCSQCEREIFASSRVIWLHGNILCERCARRILFASDGFVAMDKEVEE